MSVVVPLGWRHRAACRTADSDLFFPEAEPGTPAYEQQAAAAKAVCSGCPVRHPCLRWADDTYDKWSVAGGTTPDERRLSRKRVNATRRRAA